MRSRIFPWLGRLAPAAAVVALVAAAVVLAHAQTLGTPPPALQPPPAGTQQPAPPPAAGAQPAPNAPLPIDITPPLHFRSFVVNPWNGRTGVLDVTVKQWSTPQQAEALQTALDTNGMDGFMKVISRMPNLGYLAPPGELGLELHFTRAMRGPENTVQILAITDRWMRVQEMYNDSITTEYPLRVAQLIIKPNGQGTGVVMPMVRINYWDPKTQLLFLDNFTMEPLQLPTVKLERDHKKDKKDKKDKGDGNKK